MRRSLLISLSLVLALVGESTVCAEDGFYVIPAMRGKYAPVPKTCMTRSWEPGDDGALQNGVAWPTPHFTDHGNGTVTDNLTGLIWMKNVNAFGARTWSLALGDANSLASGSHGLTDGSKAGDWRLPNVRELQSLVDYSQFHPVCRGPFTGVEIHLYWSSTTFLGIPTEAFAVDFADGNTFRFDKNGVMNIFDEILKCSV